MVVYENHFLIYGNCTVVNFTNTDTTNVFIVVDGTDQHLCACVLVTFRCRNVINDGIK